MDEMMDKSGFKSFGKLYPLMKKNFPNMSKKEIREVVEKRLHDRRMKLKQKKPYMRTIFDPVIGCYFHDLIQQTDDKRKDYPKYFHVFIESNSRYAFAYPVNDKSAKTSIETMKKFIEDNGGKPIRKLTSDGECAFSSNEFTNFCNEKEIAVRIILDKAHSTLGLIDRFIRTLRDMNQPPNRSKKGTQYDDEHVNFSAEKMKELIESYNNTFHKKIGCTPKEMYDNVELEKEWIEKKKRLRMIQNNIEDFVIPLNTYVRYRMNAMDLNGRKRRSQFSREKYIVVRKIGSRYVLKASDGSKITKSRFELIQADDDDPYGGKFPYTVEKSSVLYK